MRQSAHNKIKSSRQDVKAHSKDNDNLENTRILSKLAQRTAEQLSHENHSPAIIIGLYKLTEFASLIILGGLSYIFSAQTNLEYLPHHLALAMVFAAMMSAAAQLSGYYNSPSLRNVSYTLPRLLIIWFGLSGFGAMLIFGSGITIFPFDQYIMFALFGGLVLTMLRFAFSFAVSRWSRNGFMERRAIIFGGGEPCKQLIRSIEAEKGNDVRICGFFDDRSGDRSPPVIAGYPKLGGVDDILPFVRAAHIDILILALPVSAEGRWLGMLKKLWVLPIDIRLAAHTKSMKFTPRFYASSENDAMLPLHKKPIADWDSVRKRAFDITFALIGLAILWPVMLGVAIAVKATSKGPILFKQKRHGMNNEEIMVFKFRSMYTHLSDEKAAKLVTKDDPRVTPVGRIIRKTSLDELPQFFNVLLGSLSLVGPRPHAVVAQANNKLFADVVDGYFARHRVKPGVTGWAQINGYRGEITSDDKIEKRTEYDLYYIENWSLLFDLKILLKTPLSLLNTENAY